MKPTNKASIDKAYLKAYQEIKRQADQECVRLALERLSPDERESLSKEFLIGGEQAKQFINYLEYRGSPANPFQMQAIREGFSIIFDDKEDLKNRVEVAANVWGSLEDNTRQDYCFWAYGNIYRLPNEVFSKILIDTHQRGKVHSLLSAFDLALRVDMFERAKPENIMEELEYQRFLSLPEKLKIYRGGSGITPNKLKYGMSWTTDQDRATWFANRFPHLGKPIIIEAIVDKNNIFGCFDYEDEIIIRGGRVSQLKVCNIDYVAYQQRWKEKCEEERDKNKELLKMAA